MTLYEIFTEKEIKMILDSLEYNEKKWKKIAESPIKGYGKSSEYAKKDDRKALSEEYRKLQSKICENLD